VGGMRQLTEIQQVVDGGVADAVSMCRPLIMDQRIVQKFRQGKAAASKCTSCNGCIEWMQKQDIHCVFNKKLIEN
jgi:2,4-dienoyl-CoA reductase-like NADH-dependent reductase (Old Yellow Enzyme family)